MVRTSMLWAASLLAVLAAGCAAERPGPSAPRPRRAIAYQQFCEQVWSLPQANALAWSRGAEGWELVGVSGSVMCFKRQMIDGPLEPPRRDVGGAPATSPPAPSGRDWGF
jgi:hypothetical protein